MKTTRPLSAKGLLARSMDELRRRSAIAWNLEATNGPADPRPLYDFCDAESVHDCIVMSDKRIGGFSQSNLDFISPSSTSTLPSVANNANGSTGLTVENKAYPISMDGLPLPTAFACFHGCISTSLPPDRPSVQRSGFAAFRTPNQSPSLFGHSVWDIDPYMYLAVRIKSDGRAYFLNLQTESIEPSDLHQHRLFARYPGQWETIMVKWNDFVRTNHGSVVEPQSEILRHKVSTFGIGLTNRVEGPFELCIEKVWATNKLVENAIVIIPKESQLQNRSGKTVYWRRDRFNLSQHETAPRIEGQFMTRMAEAFKWAVEAPAQSSEKEVNLSGEGHHSSSQVKAIHQEEPQSGKLGALSSGDETIDLKEPQTLKSMASSRKSEAIRGQESQSWNLRANCARRAVTQHQRNLDDGTLQPVETKRENSNWDEKTMASMGNQFRSSIPEMMLRKEIQREKTVLSARSQREQPIQGSENQDKGSRRDEMLQSATKHSQNQSGRDKAVNSEEPQSESNEAKLAQSSETKRESSPGDRAIQELETQREDNRQVQFGHSMDFRHRTLGREETMSTIEASREKPPVVETQFEEIMQATQTPRGGSYSQDEMTHSVETQRQSHTHEAILSADTTLRENTTESAEMPHQNMILPAKTQHSQAMQQEETSSQEAIQLADPQREQKIRSAEMPIRETKLTAETQLEQTRRSEKTPCQETILSTETQPKEIIQSAEMQCNEIMRLAEMRCKEIMRSVEKQCKDIIRSAETQHEKTMRSTGAQFKGMQRIDTQGKETQLKEMMQLAETPREIEKRPQLEERKQSAKTLSETDKESQLEEMIQSAATPREDSSRGDETALLGETQPGSDGSNGEAGSLSQGQGHLRNRKGEVIRW